MPRDEKYRDSSMHFYTMKKRETEKGAPRFTSVRRRERHPVRSDCIAGGDGVLAHEDCVLQTGSDVEGYE